MSGQGDSHHRDEEGTGQWQKQRRFLSELLRADVKVEVDICCSKFILLHSDDPRAALGEGKKAGTDGDPGKGLQRLDFESASSCSMRSSDLPTSITS